MILMKRKTEVMEPSAFFPKIQSKHKYNNGLILPTLATLTWKYMEKGKSVKTIQWKGAKTARKKMENDQYKTHLITLKFNQTTKIKNWGNMQDTN